MKSNKPAKKSRQDKLTALKVRDFQCHESFNLPLATGITTLIGPSDAGKSSLLRALRWVALNRPRGDGFIRNGARRARVTVEAGSTVVRQRGKSNLYRVDEHKLKAFGNDPPPQVLSALNLGPLNFQGQHDAPFWFDLTPPELARQLNKLIDLDSIDRVAGNLAKYLRSYRAEQDVSRQRQEELAREYQSLRSVREIDQSLLTIEDHKTWADGLTEEHRSLEEAIGRIEQARRISQRAKALAERAEVLLNKMSCALDRDTKIYELTRTIDLLERTDHDRQFQADTTRLDELWSGVAEKEVVIDKLSSMAGAVERGEKDLSQLKAAIPKAEEEFRKKSDGRCPLCGAKV